jgi:hypothetical protein
MRLTAVRAGVAFALLGGGCAGPVQIVQPGPDHPANPASAVAPLPPASTTLATNASVTSLGETPGVASPQPSTTSPAGTLYACPMHPDVTSTNPNERCPKCGMKINKPVKATAIPATKPTMPNSSGQQPPGHQHAHDGGNK